MNLNILGGIGAGTMAVLAEVRKQQEAKQKNELYKLQKAQLEDEKAARERNKDVQRTTDEAYQSLGTDTYESQPLDPELQGPPEYKKTGTVGLGDVKRQAAEKLAAKGYGKEAEAARMEYDRYKAEGVDKAISAFKRGASGEELTKIFNDHGETKISGIDSIDRKTGDIVYRDMNGQTQTMNALEIERGMLSLKDKADIGYKESGSRKHVAEAQEKEAEVKAGSAEAKVAAQRAQANNANAHAGLASVQAQAAKYGHTQDVAADQALAVPEDQRTPEQKAALERRAAKNRASGALPAELQIADEFVKAGKFKNRAEAVESLRAMQHMSDEQLRAKAVELAGKDKMLTPSERASEETRIYGYLKGNRAAANPQQATGPRARSLESFGQ